jgi:hypothetical protein
VNPLPNDSGGGFELPLQPQFDVVGFVQPLILAVILPNSQAGHLDVTAAGFQL